MSLVFLTLDAVLVADCFVQRFIPLLLQFLYLRTCYGGAGLEW